MKIFDWLLNLLGIIFTIVIVAIAFVGLSTVCVKIKEVEQGRHTLQPR